MFPMNWAIGFSVWSRGAISGLGFPSGDEGPRAVDVCQGWIMG